ncbi:DNA-binding protein H-NS [Pasteurella multocida]|uniref:DNA-binding protein n=1 Tax=Pasteurella dagmatis ATCC 43325 TaxID=667128 RepID=C9PRN9_9PAST|nr:H-NS family nucleoid-associated regulatory protein [Pasteurella dagmatis]EEX49616.1 DNA-binding protein StpA [Pasteurella dagmatis ATCC 43325]SNV69058.1 DNA-binding protein H-NS [Pasteurella dagmatis]VEI57411.1 DNA-binding protein H-NS [Pasteurella multocida]
MSELLKTLNNIRSLRVLARESTLQQLEAALEKFQQVVDAKRAEEEEALRQETARQERIAKLKESLKQEGITAEELAEILAQNPTSQRKKRQPRPAKYKYVDENGEVKTWTGQGRTPRPIQIALNEGKSLSSFEI